ncbi:hypothetical protein SETIT_3G308300v2 [Setaria italica]|uniref:Uncharacterized protein n=1 Tax=Setaria italica TaxID=4555 RepID=A0A368QL42_SETIT|nr:hypothetical protein SETIT_3G308300v2 [Setaria italica]
MNCMSSSDVHHGGNGQGTSSGSRRTPLATPLRATTPSTATDFRHDRCSTCVTQTQGESSQKPAPHTRMPCQRCRSRDHTDAGSANVLPTHPRRERRPRDPFSPPVERRPRH